MVDRSRPRRARGGSGDVRRRWLRRRPERDGRVRDPGAESHTLGIYIDRNLGGLVKDAFVAGPLASVREQLERDGPGRHGLGSPRARPAEARVRVEDALEILDHTFDPPVDEDVRALRALMRARIRTLPERDAEEDEEPERLRPGSASGCSSTSSTRPRASAGAGDEDAEDAARLAIDFGADYNHGGALRWSPVVVEIFMTTGWRVRSRANPSSSSACPTSCATGSSSPVTGEACPPPRCARPLPRSSASARRCSQAVERPRGLGTGQGVRGGRPAGRRGPIGCGCPRCVRRASQRGLTTVPRC